MMSTNTEEKAVETKFLEAPSPSFNQPYESSGAHGFYEQLSPPKLSNEENLERRPRANTSPVDFCSPPKQKLPGLRSNEENYMPIQEEEPSCGDPGEVNDFTCLTSLEAEQMYAMEDQNGSRCQPKVYVSRSPPIHPSFKNKSRIDDGSELRKVNLQSQWEQGAAQGNQPNPCFSMFVPSPYQPFPSTIQENPQAYSSASKIRSYKPVNFQHEDEDMLEVPKLAMRQFSFGDEGRQVSEDCYQRDFGVAEGKYANYTSVPMASTFVHNPSRGQTSLDSSHNLITVPQFSLPGPDQGPNYRHSDMLIDEGDFDCPEYHDSMKSQSQAYENCSVYHFLILESKTEGCDDVNSNQILCLNPCQATDDQFFGSQGQPS